MKKAIIHISDLHIFLHKDLKGKPIIKDFWLSTENDEDSKNFILHFCETINEEFNDYRFILIVTGDIANSSEKEEYIKANSILLEITHRLRISIADILIVPGDHDINRELNKNAFKIGKESNSIDTEKKSYEYLEKYDNFYEFYFLFFTKKFDAKKAIVKWIELTDEKILLIGLNSNYKIDYEGGLGHINPDSLEEEMKILYEKFPNHSRIVIFHHNIISFYEDRKTGQFEKENRVTILNMLKKYETKLILYGNEHTRASDISDNIYYSESGIFASKTHPQASFKIYTIDKNDESLSLKLNLFVMQNANKITDYKCGTWAIQPNKPLGELKEIVLNKIQTKQIAEDDTIAELPEKNVTIELFDDKESIVIAQKSTYREELFNMVKNKKIFHSGHFHWSESSRAHNWIDVSKLLQEKEDVLLAKKAIVDLIDINELDDKFDFIIGLGFEGNIISTRASIKYNKAYSYLPYSYRYDEHNDFEKKLNFINNGKFKSVLIITDVVHDGRTIRKLINKREKEFFNDVENIYVISLFYSGDKIKPSVDILNTKDTKYDFENDHEENRINFYYVLALKVEPCPYKSDYREECIIVKEGLGCVHKFYDDEKRKK